MRPLFATLSSFLRPRTRTTAPRRRRPIGLQVESLEERKVMSTTPIVDMTQWAAQFGGPKHTQELYLNFDGKHNDGANISAFVPQAGQDRDTAIQDILYRVSEIFAPFNVQVHREFGDGAYSKTNGDTTVFVGGNFGNIATSPTGIINKFTYSSTPFGFVDYASANRGFTHAVNSDPYDLSFVDPMQYGGTSKLDKGANNQSQWTNVESDFFISGQIAHEAGHTFGLAHVLTGTASDEMSYTSGAANQVFTNQTFAITTLNNSGTNTTYDPQNEQPLSRFDIPVFGATIPIPISIVTQNSFTYLQTALGKRAPDGQTHWVDPGVVDPSVPDLRYSNNVAIGSVVHGSLNATGGDYDGYRYYSNVVQQVHVNVQSPFFGGPDAMVMVRDDQGNVLFFNHMNAQSGIAHVDFQTAAGHTYFIVVGAENADSGGSFTLSITANASVPNVANARFTFVDPVSYRTLGSLKILSEDLNTGNFIGSYTGALGFSITVTGSITGTTQTSVLTSTLTFSSTAVWGPYLESVNYTGKLVGTGQASPRWNDSLDGTLFDQTMLLPNMAIVSLFGGRTLGFDK